MLNSYIPVLVMGLVAVLLSAVFILLSAVLGPRRPSPQKNSPYECGVTPIGSARERFPIKFYLIAMLFILFDIETVFLYPWAVASRNEAGIDRAVTEAAQAGVVGFSRGLVFAEVMVFIGLLAAGVVYAWRKGVFQWR